MNAIELMVEEHKDIKRVLVVIRKLCLKILKDEPIDYTIFYKVIDFVRNYADKHHHKKEEAVLFKKMKEELTGLVGESPIMGMFIEHDQGRLFISNLEQSVKKVLYGDEESKLDIIANAIAYTDLLYRHIDKEDNVIYKFGDKHLSTEAMEEIEETCKKVEKEAKERNFQNNYLELIHELEEVAGQ